MTKIELALRERLQSMPLERRQEVLEYFDLAPKTPDELDAIQRRLELSIQLKKLAMRRRLN